MAEQPDATYEPWMTFSAPGNNFSKMCSDYIFFSRILSKNKKKEASLQVLRCDSVVQMPEYQMTNPN